MYPQVAAHLRQCGICRAVLQDLMLSAHDGEALPRRVTAHDLPFLRSAREAGHEKEQGKVPSPFYVRVTLPISGAFDLQRETMRGSNPIQIGGRLLFYDTFLDKGEQAIAMFVLYQATSPGHYLIAGRLSGAAIPPLLKACLQVEDDVRYYADVHKGRLYFEDVILNEDTEQVEVTLTAPE